MDEDQQQAESRPKGREPEHHYEDDAGPVGAVPEEMPHNQNAHADQDTDENKHEGDRCFSHVSKGPRGYQRHHTCSARNEPQQCSDID